jgi:hypothetical protein
MTEEAKAAEAEAETAEASEAEAEAGTETAAAPDPETESRAKAMGWAPKDEWRGPEDRWVDADVFVKRGEEVMPILKAQLRKFEAENAEIKKTLKEFGEHHTKTEARMYQKAIRDIQAAQREAAEAGNLAQYDQLEQQKQAVVREAAQTTGRPAQKQPDIDPAAMSWRDQNPWFSQSEEMATAATTHHELLLRTKPDLSLEDNLEAVTKFVKRAFPEKFTNPNRAKPSPVEGNPAGRRAGGKGYTDLPPEAKQACDRFVKQGLMKREEYCKDYFTE